MRLGSDFQAGIGFPRRITGIQRCHSFGVDFLNLRSARTQTLRNARKTSMADHRSGILRRGVLWFIAVSLSKRNLVSPSTTLDFCKQADYAFGGDRPLRNRPLQNWI